MVLRFSLWKKKWKKKNENKCGEDESKSRFIIGNVYTGFRFVVFVAVDFVVVEFCQQYYICWITAVSPLIYTKIFSVFFVIRCHVAPFSFLFFLLFILFDSRALTFCFVIAVSRNGFCTDRWRCSKCRCVQFYFSAEITFTLNNTTHLWGYKHYNTTHVIFKQIIGSHFLLKKKNPKHDFTVKWNDIFLQLVKNDFTEWMPEKYFKICQTFIWDLFFSLFNKKNH